MLQLKTRGKQVQYHHILAEADEETDNEDG